MGELGLLTMLFTVAVVILIAEIFIPSHGILTIAGLGFLVAAIVKTFDYYGNTAGATAILASVIGLPVFAAITIRIWPRTKIGRAIAPENPVYKPEDFGGEVEGLKMLIGQQGHAVTPLRPVGTCEIGGRRVVCVCDTGLVDAGSAVRAIGVRGRDLEVTLAESTPSA